MEHITYSVPRTGRTFTLRALNALESANANALGAPNRGGSFAVACAITEVDGKPTNIDPRKPKMLAVEKVLQSLSRLELEVASIKYAKAFGGDEDVDPSEKPEYKRLDGANIAFTTRSGKSVEMRELNALEAANALALGAPWRGPTFILASSVTMFDGNKMRRPTTDAADLEDLLESMSEADFSDVGRRYQDAFTTSDEDLKNALSDSASPLPSSPHPAAPHHGSTPSRSRKQTSSPESSL